MKRNNPVQRRATRALRRHADALSTQVRRVIEATSDRAGLAHLMGVVGLEEPFVSMRAVWPMDALDDVIGDWTPSMVLEAVNDTEFNFNDDYFEVTDSEELESLTEEENLDDVQEWYAAALAESALGYGLEAVVAELRPGELRDELEALL